MTAVLKSYGTHSHTAHTHSHGTHTHTHTHTLWEECRTVNVTAGGTHSNHWAPTHIRDDQT